MWTTTNIFSGSRQYKLDNIVGQKPFKTHNQCREEWEKSGTKASRSTVGRRLAELKIKSCIAKKRTLLKKWQRGKRIDWSKKHRFLPRCYWKRILWSAERFREIPGRCRNRCYRKAGQKFSLKCVRAKCPILMVLWHMGLGAVCRPRLRRC